MKLNYLVVFLLIFILTSCKKESSVVYELNPYEVLPQNASKTLQKSEEQYISILYANLFQKALSANTLVAIKEEIESIGDKDIAHEIVISNFMNQSDVILPTDSLMLADPEVFITDTYERFFIRQPTEAEKSYLKNMILANPSITAEMVFFSFALSDEYQYY